MSLTDQDVKKILELIDQAGYEEIRLELSDLKIHVRRKSAVAPAAEPVQPAPPPQPSQPEGKQAAVLVEKKDFTVPKGTIAVRSPMVGTFYRAPSPGAPPFVEIGSRVEPEDAVCLIEVMKLFSSIQAGVAGHVVGILVEDGALVEHGEPLILIDPILPLAETQ